MSERTHAPRPGGRVTDQRGTVPARDADAQRSDARGARHFTGANEARADRSDTRRSGMRGDAGEPAPRGNGRDNNDEVRAERRASDSVRGERRSADTPTGRSGSPAARGTDLPHGKGRRPEPMIGKGRSASTSDRAATRNTGAVPSSRKRDTDSVTARKRDTGEVAARGRDTGDVGARAGRGAGVVAGKERASGPGLRLGGGLGKLGGWRRDVRAGGRTVADAPVDGSAALQVEVTAAEPLRVTGEVSAPRLRVAPPAPISAPRAPFVASVIGVVIVGVLGILLINTKTNENSFRIADLQKQDSVLDNQQQNLENQLVEVSSIGNLHAAARRLGLVEAENPALFTLPDGKIIGVLTPAKGKPAVTAQDSKATADAGAGTVVPANGQQTGQGTGTGANSGTTGLEGAANGAAGTTGTTGTSGATGTTGTTGTNGTANNGMTADGSQMSGTTSGTTGAGQ